MRDYSVVGGAGAYGQMAGMEVRMDSFAICVSEYLRKKALTVIG